MAATHAQRRASACVLASTRTRIISLRAGEARGIQGSKAPDVPGLKGDQLRSLAAARRPDAIPRHKSGKAPIATSSGVGDAIETIHEIRLK